MRFIKYLILMAIINIALFSNQTRGMVFPPNDDEDECLPFEFCESSPTTPSGVSGPSSSLSGDYTISWNASSDFYAGGWYDVEENLPNSNAVYTRLEPQGSPLVLTTNYTITGRSPNVFKYRVRACNPKENGGGSCSMWSYSSNVTVINESPTITNITNRTIFEDGNTGAVSFTIGDSITSASSLTLTRSSSNRTLIPTNNIVFGGSGANRTVRVTPAANKSGSATITVTVSDGDQTTSDTFVVTVTAINDIPTMSGIANQTVVEDSATGNIAFTITDIETNDNLLSLSASSSDTTLVPVDNITFAGIGSGRTVKVTPVANQNGSAIITVTVSDGSATRTRSFAVTVTAVNDTPTISNMMNQTINEDNNTGNIAFTIGDQETTTASLSLSKSSSNTSLVPTGNIVFGGSGANRTIKVTPTENHSGSTTVTVTVSDGELMINDSFVVTVNAIDDAPTISNITNRTIDEESNTGNIAFTIGDQETSASSLTLSKSSSNTTLVATSNIVFGGSDTNRTVKVTPVNNESGAATITVTVSDGNLSTSDTFVVTVNDVNDAPTISTINDRTIIEDGNTGNVSFTINDQETSTSSLILSKTSSNTNLIPTGNIVFGGSNGSRTVKVTPMANVSGSATITITVSDGELTASEMFDVNITAVNDVPTITNMTNQTIDEDSNTGNITFTIGDQETETNFLAVTKSSSNMTLVPTSNVILSGSGANRTVKVTPAANQSGSATITITVSDGELMVSDSFVVTVNAVNDAPVMTEGSSLSVTGEQNQVIVFDLSATDIDADTLTWSLQSSATNGSVTGFGSGNSRSLSYTPNSGYFGSDSFVVQVSDGHATDSLTVNVTINESEVSDDAPDWANSTTVSIGDATLDELVVPVNQAIGAISGNASVSGGAASYSIPIIIPPGRAGMQPNVSINYSSRSGNGIVGMGWGVSVGSAISRCGQTVANDGVNLSVQYNSDDRLCYNGQRLIAVTGDYGEMGTVYRTEMDSFAKVTQMAGNINSELNDAWFQVEHKDNTISEFGNTEGSIVIPNGAPEILSWQLSQQRDKATTANTINYLYEDFGNGEHPIKEIQYTSSNERRVEFHYEARPDLSSSYLAGGLTRQTKRLESITTHYINATIRRYELTYQQSEASNRSLLTQMTECEGSVANLCLAPTVFSWQDAKSSYELEAVGYRTAGVLQPQLQHLRSKTHLTPRGDANGDGVADWALWYHDAEGEFAGAKPASLRTCDINPLTHRLYCINVDFNQDGKTDNWRIDDNKLELSYDSDQSTPTWFNSTISMGVKPNEFIANTGDYNGDGWPDIVLERSDTYAIHGRADPAAGDLYLYLHSGNPVAPYLDNGIHIYAHTTIGETTSAFRDSSIQFMGDMDGNGLPDFIESTNDLSNGEKKPVEQPTPRTLYLTKYTSEGVLYIDEVDIAAHAGSPLGGADEAFYFHFFMDINGDGLQDWISHRGLLQYSLNIGGAFTNWQTLQNGGGETWVVAMRQVPINDPIDGITFANYPRYSSSFRQYDYDADGRSELLFRGNVLATACQTVLNHGIEEDRCGDELYDLVDNNTGGIPAWAMLETESLDDSIVEFDAVKFIEAADGSFSAQVIPTELFGSATQTNNFDAFGNGLQDFVFTYGCQHQVNDCEIIDSEDAESEGLTQNGAYILRNRGAATSGELYAANDMLVQVADGYNRVDQWTYRPLSSRSYDSANGQFYERETGYLAEQSLAAQQAYFNFSSSSYVVAEHQTSDGIDGMLSSYYRYKDALYNREGRGFQGFRTIIVDSPSGIRAVTDFEQIFPLAGQIETVRTCLITDTPDCGSNPLSRTSISYENKTTANNNVHWIVPTSQVKQSYALNNRETLLSSQTTVIALADTDHYGNVEKTTTTVNNGFSIVESVTENNFTIDEENWWLNQLDDSTVTNKTLTGSALHQAALDVTKQITTTYTWTTNRQPDVITVTPLQGDPLQGGGKVVSVDTDYNLYGLPTLVKTTSEGQTRQVATTYSADGYFVNRITNDLGHTVNTVTDPAHGQVTSLNDANGLITTTNYDAFGRAEKVTPPIGQPVYSRFASCLGGCDGLSNSNIQYKVTSYQAGSPETTQYKDSFNRTLIAKTEGFNGSDIYVRTEYDHLGRTIFTAIPSFSSSESKGTHFNHFDELNRPLEKVIDQASNQTMTVTYSYVGAQTNILATSGTETRTLSRTHSGTGQLIKTTQQNNGVNVVTQYAYDAMGNPIVLQDANGNAIEAKYNALGQKEYVNDPNMGIKTFSYTGFGEVDTEVDANGDSYDYDYDSLGRLSLRKLNGNLEASYTFDVQCLGAIDNETRDDLSGSNNYERAYNYNSHCLPVDIITTIDDLPYVMSTQYDGNYGRPKAITYPNGVTVETLYNSRGYATHSQNAASGYVYQQVTHMDARLQLIQANKANGLLDETRDYAPETGQMLSVYTDTSSGNQRHRIDYDYEGFGNLAKQTVENMRNGSPVTSVEDYIYDDLHRLTSATRNIGGVEQTAITYAYDNVGNFTHKSDYVNSYDYGNASKSQGGNAGPNAVRRITKIGGGTTNYNYDNNGNLESGDGKTLIYNAFNKPVSITKNNVTSSFYYGADQMRFKQIKTGLPEGTETTIYIDKAYEIITQGSVTKKRAYLGDAILTETLGGSDVGYKIGFVHRDRLNSVVTITDENGDVVDNKSFDAFGKPREGTFETVTPSTLAAVFVLSDFTTNGANATSHTNRGFTDHEHLDDAELIHMNGRVYDYNLGRFLSVDPFIQDPGNSQSMNPYSYIMNNPLAGIDPSGYEAEEPEPDTGGDNTEEESRQTTVNVGKTGSRLTSKVTITQTGDKVHLTGGTTGAQKAVATALENGSAQLSLNVGSDESSEIGSQSSRTNGESGAGSLGVGTATLLTLPRVLTAAGSTAIADGPIPAGDVAALGILAVGLSALALDALIDRPGAGSGKHQMSIQQAIDKSKKANMRGASESATGGPGQDPDDNRKVKNGPKFKNLKDHAHRHGQEGQSTNQYYNSAVRNTQNGQPFNVRHSGQNKINYVTRTGKDNFTFTSGSTNGRSIYTHMYNVNTRYLANKGITLPKGF